VTKSPKRSRTDLRRQLQRTPDKTGTFTFLCDVFCGSGHEDMSGTLIVT
jgi:cytochrome c oxidase subunit 2